MAKNVIIVNGVRFEVEGSAHVSVGGDSISVNGNKVVGGLSGIVKVQWEGPLASLESDGAVECGSVGGNVDAGGSVSCGDVAGDVDAGGSVNCGRVGGDIDAGGSVNCRKG